jgi:hypothetical protein
MEEKLTSDAIAEKVFELTEQFNRYVFEHPEILDHIPDKALLVFLDASDAAFNKANLALVDATPESPGSQRIYIKMRKYTRLVEQVNWEANILASPMDFPALF